MFPDRGHEVVDNLHIRLFQAHSLVIGPLWNTRNVQSSFWRFYANNRDGAGLELANGLYDLRGGRLYFVPAGVRFSCRNTQPVSHFYVHFDVIGLPGVAMHELFREPICLKHAADLHARVCALAPRFAGGHPQDLAVQCQIKALVYDGLARYLEHVPHEQRERCSQRAAALAPVLSAIRLIEADPAAPLSNRCLAGACHLSEDHFIRRFRTCVGQTPAQYIVERRVNLAAQHLLFTDGSIERIAEAAGFGSRFYFSRVFARHTGVSPAAYRKTTRV